MIQNRLWGIVLVGAVSSLLLTGWTWGKDDKKKDEPAQQNAAATESQAAPSQPGELQAGEKVVHTFASDEELKEFAKLWQQRQGVITRMAVLRSYWSEEQTRLQGMDQQLAEAYKLDPTKRHLLNPERRELVEMPMPAEASDEPGATATP